MPPGFIECPLEREARLSGVKGSLDTGDSQQGSRANRRFGSLRLRPRASQQMVRHERSLTNSLRLRPWAGYTRTAASSPLCFSPESASP